MNQTIEEQLIEARKTALDICAIRKEVWAVLTETRPHTVNDVLGAKGKALINDVVELTVRIAKDGVKDRIL